MAAIVAIRISRCHFGTIVIIILILLSLLLYVRKVQSYTKFGIVNVLVISENVSNCFGFNHVSYKILFG